MMTPEELLTAARKHLWAAWALSSEEIGSEAAATLLGLGMLVPEGGAAELERLRARVAELEAEKELWRKATYRAAGEAGLVPRESADGITQRIAPVQALRDDDPFHLHHTYRVSRDLPEMGGAG